MIKYFILLINIIGIYFLNFLLQDITVSLNVPPEVNAGGDFTVELTISKGNLESFARYQFDLPIGLTATVINSGKSEFSFEKQKVKFLWLKLPQEPTFTISYNIHVDATIKGDIAIGGDFSFITEGDRRSIQVETRKVRINNSDPAARNIEDKTKTVAQDQPQKKETTCYRKKSIKQSGKEIIVDVYVKKWDNDKFAKVQETIPQGYIASNVENNGAIFTFKDQEVKFLWMNLPAVPEFKISYRLVPDPAGKATSGTITGTFSFIDNGNTKNIDVTDDGVSLPTLGGIIADYNKGTEEKEFTSDEYTRQGISSVPQPEKGVSYSIQICALRSAFKSSSVIKNKFHLKEQVRSEMHEGWKKYTIGSFTVYKAARDYRIEIWNTTPLNDAFVSAYNNGARITVQEALMIASQEWYK